MDDIVRFEVDGEVGVGVRRDGVLHRAPAQTLAELLRLPAAELEDLVRSADQAVRGAVRLLAPIDGRTEVWGAGVTYERSRVARGEESRDSDVYDRVYDAPRPELFFKAPAWRVVADGEPVGIRRDSPLSVPEPELALWVSASGEIVGYLVCNDMTSRSIEAANPLYLPQAKIYRGSCSVSAAIVPRWELPDPSDLTIRMVISRGADAVWEGSASTSRIARRLDELVGWLTCELEFPDGVILSTGTGIVPELEFALQEGDRVSIGIPGVGTLANPVVQLTPAGG